MREKQTPKADRVFEVLVIVLILLFWVCWAIDKSISALIALLYAALIFVWGCYGIKREGVTTMSVVRVLFSILTVAAIVYLKLSGRF